VSPRVEHRRDGDQFRSRNSTSASPRLFDAIRQNFEDLGVRWNFGLAWLYNGSDALSGKPASAKTWRQLALAGLLLAAPAQAAPAPAKAETRPDAKPAAKPGGNKQISLDDDFLVEGRLEKPSAFYVLRRSVHRLRLGPARRRVHAVGA
jgi:hypothetical protein